MTSVGFCAAAITFAIVNVLPGAGNAQQGLEPGILRKPGDQFPDCFRLGTGGRKGRNELKAGHNAYYFLREGLKDIGFGMRRMSSGQMMFFRPVSCHIPVLNSTREVRFRGKTCRTISIFL